MKPAAEHPLPGGTHIFRLLDFVKARWRTPGRDGHFGGLVTDSARVKTASKKEGNAGQTDGRSESLVLKLSTIHGMGGFAGLDIPAGTRVIEYVGRKITKAESLALCEANNQYIFALDGEYDVDGNVDWNPARLINHSCEPNCEATVEDGQVWIVALRDIRMGEELTFNYGYDLEDYREYPCQCGTPGCVGYMLAEEYWEVLSSLKT